MAYRDLDGRAIWGSDLAESSAPLCGTVGQVQDQPLYEQVRTQLEQTVLIAGIDFDADIARIKRLAEANPDRNIHDCSISLTGDGLEFHCVETHDWMRDGDYWTPGFRHNFGPADTFAWLLDLLVLHRREIVEWRLLFAIVPTTDYMKEARFTLMQVLENPKVKIVLPDADFDIKDSLYQLTLKRRRLQIGNALKRMLERFAREDDRVLDTGYLVVSQTGAAFLEQETPETPGLSIHLPPGSSTHSVLEALKDSGGPAMENLLGWAACMQRCRVPQLDAYLLRRALEKTTRRLEIYTDPRDEYGF